MINDKLKIKVGITGQSGFIGSFLYKYLDLLDEIEVVDFNKDFFSSESNLKRFASKCDVIVHLAAMNRHSDAELIYNTNINLVQKLIKACEASKSKPHIIFSSSTQEEEGTIYGKSKLEGRKLFESWAKRNQSAFTGLIIPNVFGPFGKPYYNSFISTFCYQLVNNEKPVLEIDKKVGLIYVGDLVGKIFNKIKSKKSKKSIELIKISYSIKINVSKVLKTLENYKQEYFNNGIFPSLEDNFHRNLFNTFVSYINHKTFFPFNLRKHSDIRGSFIEIMRLNSGGQVSFSTTMPGVTRGNHYHTRKVERFVVIKGKAKIEIRKIGTDHKIEFNLDGKTPSFVDMPIWYTHNITNIGSEELYTIFWINEHYDPDDGDTFFEEV